MGFAALDGAKRQGHLEVLFNMKSQFACARAHFALVRALRRGALLAVAAGLIAVPSASAVTYPVAGGNGFHTNAEGWSGIAASCTPSLGGLCTETNFHSSTQGNPAGSIEAQMQVIVNAGDLFTAVSTWRSPMFDASTIGSGSLAYERQLDVTGLASLEPTTKIESVLVDETTGQARSLGSEVVDGSSETLDDGNSGFGAHTEVVPAGALELGHGYHLELRSTTTTNTAQAGPTGTASVRFDNVEITLKNAGPQGSSASRGVRFVGNPISLKKFKALARRVPWAAEVGHRSGGGVVSRKDCTIIGTSRGDRITGSKGNDVICGLGGNDRINGGGGHDIIDGGSGSDRLSGSASGDVLAGLAGRDRLTAGTGSDRVGGGASSERISGAGGNDRLKGGSGNDRVTGGSGNDRINGGPGRNRVSGGAGSNRVTGG